MIESNTGVDKIAKNRYVKLTYITVIDFPDKNDIQLRKDIFEYVKTKTSVTNKEIREHFKVGYPKAARALDFLDNCGLLKFIQKGYAINQNFKGKIDFEGYVYISQSQF